MKKTYFPLATSCLCRGTGRGIFFSLISLFALLTACDGVGDEPQAPVDAAEHGVFILCEGNYNAGNSSLSFYDPAARTVENGIFQRTNSRKLGDTGQSITVYDGMAYIAMENSGIVWKMDAETMRVRGQLEAGQTEQSMINPRYLYFVSARKAYITDLYAPSITIFDPQTMKYTGSIPTGQPTVNGYSSTERLVGHGRYVFTNCWSYSRDILVIDTEQDAVVDSIVLSSWQPKDMELDARGKLWVITDGGYNMGGESFSDNVPHLYRIDADTRQIELDQALDTDEANVQLALSPDGLTLYVINNDVYRMTVTDAHLPVRPFITAPLDEKGRRHKLYGLSVDPRTGDLYAADAIDYAQPGIVFRYTPEGKLVDEFRVGINPNCFAFK